MYASTDEARAELAGEPFKLELIDDKGAADDDEVMEVGGAELTAYDNWNPRTGERIWGDLCRGPHVPTTKYIPAFKLTRTSAAYWRGDQSLADLQRVYGTAWESVEAMDAYLDRMAEAGSATTVGSAPNWTCSAFPTSSARACRSSTPRAGSSARRWRTTRASNMPRPGTSSSTPRT